MFILDVFFDLHSDRLAAPHSINVVLSLVSEFGNTVDGPHQPHEIVNKNPIAILLSVLLKVVRPLYLFITIIQ